MKTVAFKRWLVLIKLVLFKLWINCIQLVQPSPPNFVVVHLEEAWDAVEVKHPEVGLEIHLASRGVEWYKLTKKKKQL